ncbi:hypothetical protein Tco_0226223 [Tanacetum coccineum]
MDIPAQRLDDIEEEQRAQETRAITTNIERARLLDRIKVLEGSNIGLRDALGVERERWLLVLSAVWAICWRSLGGFGCLISMIERILGDLRPLR